MRCHDAWLRLRYDFLPGRVTPAGQQRFFAGLGRSMIGMIRHLRRTALLTAVSALAGLALTTAPATATAATDTMAMRSAMDW